MDIPTHAELVDKIDRFLERHNMAVTRLGREVSGDPNLVANIRAGRQPNLDTLHKLAGVMAEHDGKLPSGEGVIAQWPIASANNGSEIIGAAGGEAGHGHPFAPTCSKTGRQDEGAQPGSPPPSS